MVAAAAAIFAATALEVAARQGSAVKVVASAGQAYVTCSVVTTVVGTVLSVSAAADAFARD